ncbi:MAG: sugar transferase [Actinomycetia bacterium]|nr:sugar transferase [Actinomycetes bacterium]
MDAAVVSAGWTTALVLTNITEEFKRSTNRSTAMAAVAIATTLAVMERRGLYAGRPTLPRTDEISRVFTSVLAGASAVAVVAAFLDWHIGAWEIILGWTIVFAARTLVRGLSRALAVEIPNAGRPETVVIVGTGHEARELADLMTDHPESSFTLAGIIGNLSVAERSGLADRWIGPTERLVDLMRQHDATGAIVTATGFRGTQFRSITKVLFESGYDVHLTTGVSRMGRGRFTVRSLCHEPLVVMERKPMMHSHYWMKRVIDIVGATIALLIAAPVMIITALLIWAQDRGPVLYTAPRAGRRGQFFPMYKFRSMVTNAEQLKQDIKEDNERTGPLFKISDDPRITRIGRFIRETSIDELPQLINVLRGDMSLVGPRPALPEEEAAFDEELRDRFEVRPGITGLWQVEARSNAAFNAYRRLDLHYVENWNLALDLRILLATAEHVITTLVLLPFLRLLRGGARADGVCTPSGLAGIEDQLPGDLVTADEDRVIDLRPAPRPTPAASSSLGEVRVGGNGHRPTHHDMDTSDPEVSEHTGS